MPSSHLQLELPLADAEAQASSIDSIDERTPLPALVLTENTTPVAILQWWEDLVSIFTADAQIAKEKVAPVEAELARIKGQRTSEARRQAVRLREQRDLLWARAEETEFRAYAMFECALNDFTPRLLTLMRAHGVAVYEDDETEIANFWDCLQRPAIEWCAEIPLRDIVREFCRENTVDTARAEEAMPEGTPTAGSESTIE